MLWQAIFWPAPTPKPNTRLNLFSSRLNHREPSAVAINNQQSPSSKRAAIHRRSHVWPPSFGARGPCSAALDSTRSPPSPAITTDASRSSTASVCARLGRPSCSAGIDRLAAASRAAGPSVADAQCGHLESDRPDARPCQQRCYSPSTISANRCFECSTAIWRQEARIFARPLVSAADYPRRAQRWRLYRGPGERQVEGD